MDPVDFLGIGAQKAGTTWLFRQLSRHPQMAFPRGKEVHYWDGCATPSADEWARMLQPVARRTPDGRPVRAGEITPAYALLPEASIRAIHARCPDLRLFMILRNPIERAWSAALMELARAGMKVEDATDQWFIDAFRAPGSRQRGDYATTLERWWSVFPQDRLLVLFHEDVAPRPREVLAALAAHLAVDAADFAALPDAALAEVVVPALGKDLGNAPQTVQPSLRSSLFSTLLEIHAEDIARLERLLGPRLERDLRSWREPPRAPSQPGPRVSVRPGRA